MFQDFTFCSMVLLEIMKYRVHSFTPFSTYVLWEKIKPTLCLPKSYLTPPSSKIGMYLIGNFLQSKLRNSLDCASMLMKMLPM